MPRHVAVKQCPTEQSFIAGGHLICYAVVIFPEAVVILYTEVCKHELPLFLWTDEAQIKPLVWSAVCRRC